MKKMCVALCALIISTSIFAGGGGSSSKPLDGSYPIVLSHGLFGWGDSDNDGVIGIIDYWGGMDSYLRSEGGTVYAPQKSAANSNEQRGQELKNKILYYMAANGHSKVHVLGHSQGGLDSRYMTSNLGMGSKVSTLTSINSPHHGSPIADIVETVIPSWLQPFVADILGALVGIVYGSGEQDVLAALGSLTTSGMATFNSYTPNSPSTRYYSYGSYMTWADPVQHPLMFLLHPACAIGGGLKGQGTSCDGLVPYSSQKWGTFKGRPDYSWWVSGLDHLQVTNTLHSGQAYFDVEGHFLNMAVNAKNNQ